MLRKSRWGERGDCYNTMAVLCYMSLNLVIIRWDVNWNLYKENAWFTRISTFGNCSVCRYSWLVSDLLSEKFTNPHSHLIFHLWMFSMVWGHMGQLIYSLKCDYGNPTIAAASLNMTSDGYARDSPLQCIIYLILSRPMLSTCTQPLCDTLNNIISFLSG